MATVVDQAECILPVLLVSAGIVVVVEAVVVMTVAHTLQILETQNVIREKSLSPHFGGKGATVSGFKAYSATWRNTCYSTSI